MYQKIACYICFPSISIKFIEFIHLMGITSQILCQKIGMLLKCSLGYSMSSLVPFRY